jgi:hypothetical protein
MDPRWQTLFMWHCTVGPHNQTWLLRWKTVFLILKFTKPALKNIRIQKDENVCMFLLCSFEKSNITSACSKKHRRKDVRRVQKNVFQRSFERGFFLVDYASVRTQAHLCGPVLFQLPTPRPPPYPLALPRGGWADASVRTDCGRSKFIYFK